MMEWNEVEVTSRRWVGGGVLYSMGCFFVAKRILGNKMEAFGNQVCWMDALGH